jgi:hypothetical protein
MLNGVSTDCGCELNGCPLPAEDYCKNNVHTLCTECKSDEKFDDVCWLCVPVVIRPTCNCGGGGTHHKCVTRREEK